MPGFALLGPDCECEASRRAFVEVRRKVWVAPLVRLRDLQSRQKETPTKHQAAM